MHLHSVPHLDQYFGVWSMYEPVFNSIRTRAENINLQVHMDGPAPQAAMQSEVSVTDEGIALFDVSGTMMKHRASLTSSTSTVELRREIRAAKASSRVLGGLALFDTPGGTAAGTLALYEEFMSFAASKPLFGFADMAASAGYFAAAAMTKLYVGADALTGSIGVFNVVYDLSKRAESEGVDVKVIKAGEMKGAGIPGSEITEAQLEEFQKIVDAYYSDFRDAVAEGRKLPTSVATELADGRIHYGQAAVDIGLADGVRTADDVMAELLAAIKTDSRVQERGVLKMDDDTKTTDVIIDKPATIEELEASLPGASAEFILSQAKVGATLTAALQAHVANQAKEIDIVKKSNRGTKPLDEPTEDVEQVTAEPFKQRFQKRVDAGMSRPDAMRETIHEDPDAYRQYIADYNDVHGDPAQKLKLLKAS